MFVMMNVSIPKAVLRGAMRRCAHCGRGELFDGWYQRREKCERCGLIYEPDPGSTWGFTYISAAAITGIYGAVLFLIHFPQNHFERAIYFFTALGVLIGTMPRRKGMTLAIDYLIRARLGDPEKSIPESDEEMMNDE